MCCPSEHKRGLFDVWQIILEMILVKEKKDVSTKAVWGEKFKDGLADLQNPQQFYFIG